MLKRLERIDARIIYLFLAVGICVPLIWPMGLPLHISRESQQVFDLIDRLPEGANVMVSYDFTVGAVAELIDGLKAVLLHLSQKDAKIVGVTSSLEGLMYASSTLEEVCGGFGKVYGADYVNLGYFAGGETGLSTLSREIRQVFKRDSYGTDIDNLELMSSIKAVTDFDLVISFNSGPTGGATTPIWVRIVHNEYRVPLVLYVVTVMAPANMPYLHAGQVSGLLAGLASGAEYEQLLQRPASAVAAMDAQSIAHLIIIGFVVLGNIAMIFIRRKGVAGE